MHAGMNQDINKPTTESYRAAIPASDGGDCLVGGEPRAREADVFCICRSQPGLFGSTIDVQDISGVRIDSVGVINAPRARGLQRRNTQHRANSAQLDAVTGAAGQLADNVLKVSEHLRQASRVVGEYVFDVEINVTMSQRYR